MWRELFFPIALFCISSVGIFFSYFSVIEAINDESAFSAQLKVGQQQYALLDSDRCIGSAKYDFEVGPDSAKISSNGTFNVQYLSDTHTVTYTIELHFNSIGQLGGTLARVNVGDKFILLGTQRIDPIDVTIKSNLLQNDTEFNSRITGPIELKQIESDTYTVRAPYFQKIVKSYGGNFDAAVFLPRPIKTAPLDEFAAECENERQSSFDLTAVVQLIKASYGL